MVDHLFDLGDARPKHAHLFLGPLGRDVQRLDGIQDHHVGLQLQAPVHAEKVPRGPPLDEGRCRISLATKLLLGNH